MKVNYLLICILCLCNNLFGQACLSGFGNVFETQAAIDNFSIDNPDCIEVNGGLTITGSDITNLNGFSQIEFIEGDLEILDAPNLTSLSGLENLSLTLGVKIENTPITNLDGLSGLEEIDGDLRFVDIPNLVSLTGLLSLSGVLEDLKIDNIGATNLEGLEGVNVEDDINILNNANLTTLIGLEGVTELEDALIVTDNPVLISFEGLNNLTEVGYEFFIKDNASLQNFIGLESLETIGDDFVLKNNSTVNFEGLSNLTVIGGYMEIEELEGLEDFTGLTSITEIYYLFVAINNNLTSLDGLNTLTTANSIYIDGNEILTDLTALSNLSTVNTIFLLDNPNLSICHIPFSLCQLYPTLTSLYISGNAPGCISLDEVLSLCESVYSNVHYPIFYDLNANGILDAGEPYYPDGFVHLAPGNTILKGNETNGGSVLLNDGTYVITFDPALNPDWELTTAATSYTFVVDTASGVDPDTMYFGLQPTQAVSNANAYLSSNLPRCNEYVTFTPFGKNEGTTTASGTMWFEVDPEILDVQFIDQPDTTVAPNLYGWHFQDLYPGFELNRRILLQIPGPPDFPIGDSISNHVYLDYVDGNGIHESSTYSLEQEVQCSYDPNDKLVSPVYPENYALMDEALVYNVRFQNTGNAEAYDVVIRDTLDANLNPTTFKFIGTSHPEVLTTSLEAGQYLSFDFANIFLPDSTSDFEASQGFVMYSIEPLAGLPEETQINNTAFIYFDLNPAVVTNTTENILLSSFDMDEDGFDVWNDCDDNNALANPNGIEIPNNDVDEDCDGYDLFVSTSDLGELSPRIFPNPTNGLLEIQLMDLATAEITLEDLTGRTILEKQIVRNGVVDLSELPDAIYLLTVKTEVGVWTERVVKQ